MKKISSALFLTLMIFWGQLFGANGNQGYRDFSTARISDFTNLVVKFSCAAIIELSKFEKENLNWKQGLKELKDYASKELDSISGCGPSIDGFKAAARSFIDFCKASENSPGLDSRQYYIGAIGSQSQLISTLGMNSIQECKFDSVYSASKLELELIDSILKSKSDTDERLKKLRDSLKSIDSVLNHVVIMQINGISNSLSESTKKIDSLDSDLGAAKKAILKSIEDFRFEETNQVGSGPSIYKLDEIMNLKKNKQDEYTITFYLDLRNRKDVAIDVNYRVIVGVYQEDGQLKELDDYEGSILLTPLQRYSSYELRQKIRINDNWKKEYPGLIVFYQPVKANDHINEDSK